MSLPESGAVPFQPRRPALTAVLVFALAALTLCWPMLAGRWLLGDDQLFSGYAFRLFGAEQFRATGHIPQWNPYIFGGLPFIGAMHGDIFYPTAWLRWIMPVDTAMNIGFALHIVLAGCTMYALLRSLRLSWTAALGGGLAYELTGIVASLVRPGHDGKLFVASLAPLAFLALLRAIRGRESWAYGLLALVIGLCMISPHYQMTYYLLVAAGIWTLWLIFFDPERPAGLRWPVVLACALGAVVLGLAVSAIQAMPFLSYLPYSPRGAGGPSTGWEYATAFAMPVEELFTTVLPQFNGVLDHYWGSNFFKTHTEYLGATVVLLAAFGVSDRTRGRLRWGLGAIGLLFLLVALGGHTPFYRLWYEVMPMMKKVRAAGMAFYLVALVVCVYAAFGIERLQRGGIAPKQVLIGAGVLGAFALLGLVGALQGVAEAIALPQRMDVVAANAGELQLGALRLLAVVAIGGVVFWAVAAGRLRGGAAAAAFALVVAGDLWSIDHLFFLYHPRASVVFAEDAITSKLRAEAKQGPFRVFDLPSEMGAVYRGSALMAHDIQTVFGYHGNEVRFYDELWGGKNVYKNALSANLWDLFAVRYLVIGQQARVPGFHQVLGPVPTDGGQPAFLYARDSISPPYVRVIGAAVKVPDDQTVATVIDPRFPVSRLVLFSDTAAVTPARIAPGKIPSPPEVTARLTEWAPGRMRVALSGQDSVQTYLLISETWYPDWHVTVDGKPAAALRGDNALLTVALPAGARDVALQFHSPSYDRGKLVTALALLLTAALIAVPRIRRRAA